MFNSIRKDDNCRKLVKSFEILRLQNKIIIQAMSISDVFPTRESDVEFFDNTDTKLYDKRPSLLSSKSLPPTIDKSKAIITDESKIIGYENKKPKPAVNHDKGNKALYNYNCFTELELCNSSLHLFAKKRAKAENENKITNLSIISKVKFNSNKASLKGKAFYEVFSSSLLSLAKDRIISLPRNSSKGRVKNRCIETGRSHSVLRFCKLSRICLRDNASKALISGISKASW